MTIQIPRDFEHYPFTRRLIERFGRSGGVYAAFRTWCELAYQTEAHGYVGWISLNEAPLLCGKIREGLSESDRNLTDPEIIEALISSGMLSRGGKAGEVSEMLHCEVFSVKNPSLDSRYSKMLSDRMSVARLKRTIKTSTTFVTENVHGMRSELWKKDSDRDFTSDEMTKIATFIVSVNRLLNLPDKMPKTWDVGLIQSAARVLEKHTWEKVAKYYLKQLVICRSMPGVPRNTESLLESFDKVLELIKPEGGWPTE